MKEKRKFTIMIAPSYKCNASCDYCYASDYSKKFTKEMSFWDFVEIIDRHKEDEGGTVSIIGGEPSLWKHINKAIMYCKIKGLKTKVFTNGIKAVKIMPTTVYLNVNHYFDPRKEELIEKSLEYYKKKGVKIIFRYNISSSDKDSVRELFKKIDMLVDMSKNKKYSREIHFALAVPYVISKETGNLIYNSMKRVVDSGVKCSSPNSLPPCMFNDNQLEFLRNKVDYYSVCILGMLPLINPDGKTIQPCSKWNIYKDIRQIKGSMRNVSRLYEKELEKAKKKAPLRCQSCEYFQKNKCNVACWAYAGNMLFSG